MKRISFFLFSFLLIQCTKKSNDYPEYQLKGNVKSLTETSYKAVEKFGEIKTGEKKREFFWEYDFSIVFNDLGNKVEENLYNSDGSLYIKKKFDYDNNKLSFVSVYNNLGDLTFKWKYLHEEESTKKSTILVFNSKGELNNKIENYYNSQNLKTTEIYYSNGIAESSRNEYLYDKKNRLASIKNTSNENNNIESYTYNNNNLIAEIKYENKEGTTIRNFDYKLDDYNNVIEEINLVVNRKRQFIYDEKGNWIKQILFFNDTPQYILIRNIIYM